MPHRLTHRVLIAALPLAAMAISRGEHALPRAGWSSVISPPPVDAAAAAPRAEGPPRQPDVLKSDALKTYGGLPLQFETNRGQTDPTVKFLARGAGYTVFLTPSEAVLVLRSPQTSDQPPAPLVARRDRRARAQREKETRPKRAAAVVRLGLVGANPDPGVMGLDPLPGTANYFTTKDPHKWRTAIPTYAKVKYRDVYPGVDVVYYGAQRQLEYDFVVAPGADPARIRLAVTGANALSVDAAGDLVLQTASGALRLHKPLIYQVRDGARQEIAGGYVLFGKDRVGFRIATYDSQRPVVIDPVLSYATYLGGSSVVCDEYGCSNNNIDYGAGIAVDSAGNAYVTGFTISSDFPTANALQPALRGTTNAFVAKLNPAGSALVYSTYLGGSNSDDGSSIAVDSAGNAYVTGTTSSGDFPTVNALQPALRGTADAFVAKLNPAGSALVYSTYLGGSNYEGSSGIAVDSAGNAYVTGTTFSFDFPTANALQSTLGGASDAFVAKIDAAGALVYSTYLGGAAAGDDGAGIAVDSAGNAYVTGSTRSSDFPTTNALQSTLRGIQAAFVAKLNAAGSALVYSTYLGGSNFCTFYQSCYGDDGASIAVDSAGNAYVTGTTYSSDFPTANALQPTLRGVRNVFVAKLNAAGSALVYSTYLGGSGSNSCDQYGYCYRGEYGAGIAVDTAGNAYVTGSTSSFDFPTANALLPSLSGLGEDAFVAKLNAAGSALVYSTYLGGSDCGEWYVNCYGDEGYGIAVDSAGNAYVTGFTSSVDFPTTANAPQRWLGGGVEGWPGRIGDAFVVKIDSTTQPVASFTSACSGITCAFDGSSSSDSDGTIVSYSWNFGDGMTGSGPTVSHTYAVTGTYAVELTVTDNAGTTGTQSKSVTVIPALSSLNLNPASVTTGSTSSGTVTLSAAAPAGGAVVALASSNTAVATVPTSMTVAAGATSATFTVSTNSLTGCASSVATISAIYGGVTRSAGLTVTPATDTVAIQQADYFATRHQLRVAATSAGSTAALQVYVTSTGELIGTLKRYDGNRYSGQFTWPLNPQNITVRSSLCGSATKAVTSK
jgi:PKD repeat protein